jgi:hypothetical protein
LSTVQAANLMDGSIRIVDAKDENGAYASFIIGTAMQGRYVYCLKLKADGMIDKLQWEDYRPNASAATWPIDAPVEVWYQPVGNIITWADPTGFKTSGKGNNAGVYAVYLIDNKLIYREVGKNTVRERALPDNQIATSAPRLGIDYFYFSENIGIGTQEGHIVVYGFTTDSWFWQFKQLFGSFTGVAEPIRHLGWTRNKGIQYLRAQGDTSIGVRKLQGTWDSSKVGGDWNLLWSARIGSGMNYTGNGKTTQALPLNAKITADSTIAAGKLYVPLTVQASSSALQCTDGDAYVYIFNLEDGSAGTMTLGIGETSTQITGKLQIGTGDASKPTVYFSNGTEPRLAFGAAKNSLNSAQAGKIVKLATPRSLGLRGVRVVGPK